MPLKFLSNTENYPFILYKKGRISRLKDKCAPFWDDETLRNLLRERVEYTLPRYFQQRGNARKTK